MKKTTIKTYNDILIDNESDKFALKLYNELYEKLNTLTDKEYSYIKECVKTTKEVNVTEIENSITDIKNEGIVGGIIGGLGGIIAGDKLGKAVCQALGITSGPLYNLITSKLVVAAIATYLGLKL